MRRINPKRVTIMLLSASSADANGDIDVLFHQVHVSIHQLQPYPDIRKRALEFRDNGQNMSATQDCRRGDDQSR